MRLAEFEDWEMETKRICHKICAEENKETLHTIEKKFAEEIILPAGKGSEKERIERILKKYDHYERYVCQSCGAVHYEDTGGQQEQEKTSKGFLEFLAQLPKKIACYF